ncbi:MAG: hypothetical protein AAFP90_18795, partial [Planctomycetota bacterium]
ELGEITRNVAMARQRIPQDIESMRQAKEIDQAKVQQYLPSAEGEVPAGSNMLTQVVNESLRRARHYLDSGRSIAGWTVSGPENQRERGVDYGMLGSDVPPQYLIRRCELNGMLTANRSAYQLTGVVRNLTNQPTRLKEPVRARLQLEGPQLVEMDYLRDPRATTPTDQLTIHWPAYALPHQKIGKSDQLAVSVDGGPTEIWLQINTVGEEFSGRLVSQQNDARIRIAADNRVKNTVVMQTISQRLNAIDKLNVDATFSGTWNGQTPKLQDVAVDSNVTQVLQDGWQQGVQAQVADARRVLQARMDLACQTQQQQLNQWLNEKQEDLGSLVGDLDEQIQKQVAQLTDQKIERYTQKLGIRGLFK